MSIIQYDPFKFKQIEHWRKDLDKFFNTGFGFQSEFSGLPRVDVHEQDNEVIVTCDIPGLAKKEDVQISVEDTMLTIQGIITRNNEIQEDQIHRMERFVGRFQRSIPLPSRVKTEGTKASYKNGILEVRMSKAGKDKEQQIQIEFH